MYVAGPPASDAAAGRRPLHVSRARRAVFTGSSAAATSPALRAYLTDLVRPAGLRLAEDHLAAGRGQSYGEMAKALIEKLVPPDEPAGLLVLAFAVPDVAPERATASYLSRLCPGEPMAFAICDQGSAAPFTGLRIVREYSRAGGCGRALLIVAEQAVLHHEPAQPVTLPGCHAAVGLLFGDAGPVRLGAAGQRAATTPARATGLLATELAALARRSKHQGAPVLVLGNGLAAVPGARDIPGAGELRVAPAGQPSTGVWWELAGRVSARRPATGNRQTVLADYEPSLGYLCWSVWQ